MILEIKNIVKRFGENEILKGVSLSVDKGETVAVIGPSGSGKSTLLRCATALERADGGEILYNGKALMTMNGGVPVFAKGEELARIRASFGLVFQNFNLFPHMSVMQNITLAPTLTRGVSKEEAKQKALSLLERMGLADKAAAYPCELSGGQQQRVAIARALAMEPVILCFDEPTSALDPELTGEVLRVIRELKEAGRTMILVTHEMGFARSAADKVIFMADGVIEEYGTPEEVFGSPRSEKTISFLEKSLENIT